jgi:succinyl-CoA synthetase beta subunit
MKIHEYQGKEILRKYGVAVPNGEMATTLEEADTAAKQLFSDGNAVVVVKAQIHAGRSRWRRRLRRRRRFWGCSW